MITRRQLCPEIISGVLAKSRARSFQDIWPTDERFDLFAEIMHAHVFPKGCGPGGRILAEWQISRNRFSLWRWRHGGRRRFLQSVTQTAWSELEGIDYTQFNFAPLLDLLRHQAHHFCEMLHLQDQSTCRLRLAGLSADLDLLDRKLAILAREQNHLDIHYRIDLLEHAFEAHITSRNALSFLPPLMEALMDEEQKPLTTLALPFGKQSKEFGELTVRQKQGLALVENRQRLALAADVAARQIRLQSSAVDMDQTIQRVQELSRSTRADFTIRSTHTTASGETTISVNRNNNLMIILAVTAGLLLLFLLK